MAEAAQAEICKSRHFLKGCVTFGKNFSRLKGAFLKNHCWHIDAPSEYQQYALSLCHNANIEQTDRQIRRISTANDVLA